jgi:hypothetical protein
MRPARSRHVSRRAQIARVRTELRAHVDWLRGMPIASEEGGLSWLVLPASDREGERVITIDRARLSATARCVLSLKREHGAALASIVGDVDRWSERVLAAGARWKPCVHDGVSIAHATDAAVADAIRALPAGVARRARDALAFEGTRASVNALVISNAVDASPLDDLLAALALHRARVAALLARGKSPSAELAALALLEIARADGARADALFALIDAALAADCDTAAHRFVQSFPLPTAESTGMVATRPPRREGGPRCGDAVFPLLTRLGKLDARERHTVLAFASATSPSEVLRLWGEADATRARLDARARTKSQWHADAAIIAELRALEASLPPNFDLDDYTQNLFTLAEPRAHAIGAPLMRVVDRLRRLPDAHTLIAARYASLWCELLGTLEPTKVRRAASYLCAFDDFLARLPSTEASERLMPWHRVLFEPRATVRWFDGIEDDVLDALTRDAEMARFFAILAGVAIPFPSRLAAHIVEVCSLSRAPFDEREAIARVDALAEYLVNDQVAPNALRVTGVLAPDDAKEHAAIVIALSSGAAASVAEMLAKKAPHLDSASRRLLRRMLVEAPREVTRWACSIAIASARGVRVRSQPSRDGALPAWCAEYPAALHEVLAALASCDEDAEDTAARILANDLPSDASLREEIAAIERKSGPRAAHLDRRLAMLRSRLAAPRATLSTARLAKLASKLERAADRARWSAWSAAHGEACARAVSDLLGVDPCPAWAESDVGLRIIAGALELDEPHRALAIRMLRLRAGPPPWDLRDAPENDAVLRALVARGIDPRPWIDGIGSIEATLARGGALSLALEDDPLEIFQMGERFSTCLSIGGGNFFSVFANAADIDKRVLYARDADGNVCGRCLLALDDDGHVLSFHPYAHGVVGEAELSKHVGAFTQALATRMGTVSAACGRVRARVASDWYDDGPRDFAAQFSFLSTGSTFVKALETATPPEVTKLATDAFAPHALDAVTIPLVLSLPAIANRPELALPLIALLEKLGGHFSDSLRVTIARLAHAAGDLDRARAIGARALAVEVESQLVTEPDHADQRLIDAMLDLDPAALLAIARRATKTSPSYGDERLTFVTAAALERLGRFRRAIATLEAAGDGRSIREAVAAIERKLATKR